MHYPPLFIIGNPRSGTTLLRLIINAHSQFCVPPECGFIQWLYSSYRSWSAKWSQDQSRVDQFLVDLANCRKIETWHLDMKALQSRIQTTKPDSYADLCATVLIQYIVQEKPAAIRWGDKNNYYIQHTSILQDIFPNASFLCIVRDGRDVACSYRELIKRTDKSSVYYPNLPADISEIAKEWATNNQVIKKLIASEKATWVRYEDLVHMPEETIHNVCSSLGIPFESRMLSYHTEKAASEPAEMLAWKEKTQSAITSSQTQRYRRDLTGNEIRSFEKYAGDILDFFGYPLHTN